METGTGKRNRLNALKGSPEQIGFKKIGTLKSLGCAPPNTIDESLIGKYSDGKIRKIITLLFRDGFRSRAARCLSRGPLLVEFLAFCARGESTDKGQLALPFICGMLPLIASRKLDTLV